MSTKHKDGTGGVWGCEAFDSRKECPQCCRYDALLCLEDAEVYLRVLGEPTAAVRERLKEICHDIGRFKIGPAGVVKVGAS